MRTDTVTIDISEVFVLDYLMPTKCEKLWLVVLFHFN